MGNEIILPKAYIIKNGEDPMKIKTMTINNICGIKHLDLTFNKGLNIICGENGVGKTTILRAINHQFIHGNDQFIKKHYGTEKGTVNISLFEGNQQFYYEVSEFVPGHINCYSNNYKASNDILFFSSARSIDYKKINALPASKDINTDNNSLLHSSNMLTLSVDYNIKDWFVNRFLFSSLAGSLSDYQEKNFELCKKLFHFLNDKLSVKIVKPDFEILLDDKGNDIYFEMLSDGYKSAIYILLGIIEEIEYRFPEMYAENFDGIIMVDEIDIHLHPQWQAKLVKILVQVFPKAQVIATTHSPSVLQTLKKEEIIPLYRDDNDNIQIKELNLSEYGLQGWTLEEIMQDVMGMPSTTSELYAKSINEFDRAVCEENVTVVKEKYEILDKMLPPNSTLRKLLQIQMAGMEE